MPFRVVGYNKPIDMSSMAGLKQSIVDVVQWTTYELQQVASAFQSTEPDQVWQSPPPKPRRGTTAYADGTNWNPGAGEGPYYFNGTAWVPAFPAGGMGAFTAWTPYTPTISCTAGSYTTASASGRYMLTGKVAFVTLRLTITTVGTATGSPLVGLPATSSTSAAALPQFLHGRENAINGKTVTGLIPAGGSTVQLIYYDNSAPAASGLVLPLSGTYETA